MGPAALAAVPVAEIALGTVFGATLIGGTVIIVKNIIEIKQRIEEKLRLIQKVTITDLDRNGGQAILFSKYCKIFDLSQQVVNDINKLNLRALKKQYRRLIEMFRLNDNQRKSINQAYDYLNRKYFGTSYSNQQQKFITALFQQDLQKLNQILLSNPELINFRQKGSNYPLLYLAVRTGCYEVVQFILNRKIDLNFSKDKSTPMHCAAFYGHYQIIGLLVSYGLPINVKNFAEFLPIDEAKTDQIKEMIINAQKDNIHDLITKLSKQDSFIGKLTIKHQQVEVVRKIILKDYLKSYDFHDDSFHGTPFQNLFSIAKHGLKKAGDFAGQQRIIIPENHIQDKDWAQRIFTSPSIFYAGCSFYSPEIQFLNTRNNKKQIWLPIVQVKLKKNTYQTYRTTSSSRHTPRQDEPTQIEYISSYKTLEQRDQKVTVVALIFVKKQFLDKKMKYKDVTNTILNSPEENQWKTHYMKHKK